MPIAVLERPAAFNQDLKALQCRGDINPYFALYALADRSQLLLDLVDEATHGTKRLSSERLMAVVLPVPSIEEQEAIVHAVQDCDNRIEGERSHLERLRSTKERLARALLSGEVRVRTKERQRSRTKAL
jgi:type I restriction enzyme S subunit